MQLSDILAVLKKLAPLHYAEDWDNVGLLCGDAAQAVSRVLCCVDLTHAVLDEALAERCELVVSYHPPLFKAVKRLDADAVVPRAWRHGVAVYSPHTALDVAPGGTNDVLADVVGMLPERRALRPAQATQKDSKLVFFVPADRAQVVCDALFVAGAGGIGGYLQCSFQTPGVGTFLGGAETQPRVGRPGRLERVDELRIETVVPEHALEPVVAALRRAHPYEEPAFDLLPLRAPPSPLGLGRVGLLPQAVSRTQMVQRVKAGLGVAHVLVAGPSAHVRAAAVTRVAVCAGAGGDLLDDVLAHGAQLFVTGEVRHHEALRAQAAGVSIIAALHSNSERVTLPALAQRITADAPNLEVCVSRTDKDPLMFE